ncbi:hypothetical protein ACFX1W_041175 [Malus domestica]
MKQHADKHRTKRTFAVGDMVYLRLIPYQHQSLASHLFHKLQPKFYGPFEVIERIGTVSYKIKLHAHSKLHPVFHVSCLKKQLGVGVAPTTMLPDVTDDGLLQATPLTILQHRVVTKANSHVPEVLVHWKNHCKEDATWKEYEEFKRRFPCFQP